LKVLDRYLTRELLTPVICCAVTLIFLVLIADLFDNLDEILENKTSALIVLKYYLSLVPYAFRETIAWAAWLGTMFLLVNFGLHNETIAMKAAGLKISSIIRPVIFIGFLIGVAVFLVNDRVVPITYRIANDLKEIYIENRKERNENQVIENVTYLADGDRLYYFRKFLPGQNRVEDVIALWLDKGRGKYSRQKMIAESGTWDGKSWKFAGVMEYLIDSQGRILGEPRTVPEKTYADIKVSPEELVNLSSDSSYLPYRKLKSTIKQLRENGINPLEETVDLHQRLAAPWQGLVMILIAVPILAPTRNRKAIAGSILLCVILVFAYHVTTAIGLALGKAGKIIPFLGAWLSNILFALGAVFTLDRANH